MLEAIFTHSTLGFCIWDIPALIVLIAIVVVFIVHRHNQKKREKDFEDQLAERWADKSVDSKTA
nr:hypothetical protein [uncultured Acetobacterium sp.]